MTNRQLSWCCTIAVTGFVALLTWRSCSDEARKMKKKILSPPHTHTVTFTCSRTCTDMSTVPEVFPWR